MAKTSARIVVLLFMAIALLAYGTGWSAKKLETDSVQLRGSGTISPIAQQAAEMYMKDNPGTIVTVTSTGTMRGIKSLIDATCNIAMASAESDEELNKHAKDNDVTMTKHVIAFDALVPIVHPGSSISNISSEDLRKLFSGEIANWQQLGGPNLPVVVASYSGASGNFETWKHKVMKAGKVITPSAKILSSDGMPKFVSETPGAIGYVGLPYLTPGVKAVSVDGIKASQETIISHQYPLARELELYTTQHASEAVKKFIAYMSSDKAKTVIQQAGVIPHTK